MDSVETYARRYALNELLSPDLVEALRLLERKPGEFIIRANDPLDSLLFLVEGRCKVYSSLDNGQSVLAAFYAPFDVLGEAELFSSERYALTSEAITETACLSLPVAAIRKAADRNGRLFMYLCGRLGAKLLDRNLAESINLRYPVESRLASYLLASTNDEGSLLGTDDLGELADFLGASYRQLARVVRAFRDQGIMDRSRGRIRVLDKARLKPLAGDLYVHSISSMASGYLESGSHPSFPMRMGFS